MHSGEAQAQFHADRQLTQTLTHNTPLHAQTQAKHIHTQAFAHPRLHTFL